MVNIVESSLCYPDGEIEDINLNNINNDNNGPDFITVDFGLKNNKTVDFVVSNKSIRLQGVFNSAKKADPNKFKNYQYENPVFTLREVKINSGETIMNFMGSDNSN